jgi:hypothetical protein
VVCTETLPESTSLSNIIYIAICLTFSSIF